MSERETALKEALRRAVSHTEHYWPTPNDEQADVMNQAYRVLAGADPVPVCQWRETEDGQWRTSCGRGWDFVDGGPADNRVKFCIECGKPVEPVALVPAEGDR